MNKRITLIAAMAMLLAGNISAQWNTNSTPIKIFDGTGEGDYYGCTPKVARTADGKTWISYKIWDSDNYESGHDETKVRTYVQLLDKDGVKQFAEPGLLVNDYNTPTWWSDYGMAVTSDGCCVVTTADSRSETFNPAYGSFQTFQPSIYKIDQEGNQLWGIDGITYEEFQDAPFTNVTVIGDDIYFQLTSIDEKNPGSFVNRISLDGVPAWEECKPMYGQMIQSLGTDFLLFGSGGYGAQVQRYNRDLEPVWPEPVTYDSYTCSSHDLHPYKLAADGKGGAAVTFVRNMGDFSHNIRAQHISADGELGFGLTGIDVYDAEEYDHNYCGVAVNPETEEIMIDWQDQLDGQLYPYTLGKYTFYGDRLWGDKGLHLAEKYTPTGYAFARIGTAALPGGDWLVAYCDVAGWADEIIVVKRIDKDGNQIWRKNIGRNIEVMDAQLITEDGVSYIFWRDNSNKVGINAIRIFHDGSFATGIDNITEDTDAVPVAYYTVDGKKIAQPEKGLNIVKYSDGSTRKFFAK